MKLLIIDPNLSVSSPSMKGVVRSLPAMKAAGIETEIWCWNCDDDAVIDRVVRLPKFLNIHTVGTYVFTLMAMLRSWWLFSVCGAVRPDVIYTVAWYLPSCDVCHVHFSPWDWASRQRELGMKSLRDVYDRISTGISIAFARWFLLNTTAKHLISVSRAVADDLKVEAPDRRVTVLPNSYDASRFNMQVRNDHREPTRSKLGLSADDRVFVFASAGHYRRKGFFLAVEALMHVRKDHPHAKLLVLGGRDKTLQGLQQQLDKSAPDWRDWIIFTGMVPDIERYYAAGDAFLFPSYSEAFALVEVETAACGLPLFLTRHHGSEMILEDGINGRFLEFNAERIADVLKEFITGQWRPSPIELKHALDGEAYAKAFIAEIKSAA
jgi:glycosyltransferase involved in cell wall biosynthesis